MSESRAIQNNFSMGELSPRTYGRSDQPWFMAGCRELLNMIPIPQGPAVSRPGMIRNNVVPNTTLEYRVESYSGSSGTTYLLLITATDIVAYTIGDGTHVEEATPFLGDGDIPCACSVTYGDTNLEELQIVAYEGDIWICHPNHPLSCYEFNEDNATLTRTEFSPVYPQYVEEDKDDYVTNDIRAWRGNLYMSNIDAPQVAPTEETIYYDPVGSCKVYGINDVEEWDEVYAANYVLGNYVIHNNAIWVLGELVTYTVSCWFDGQEYLDGDDPDATAGSGWYDLSCNWPGGGTYDYEYVYYPFTPTTRTVVTTSSIHWDTSTSHYRATGTVTTTYTYPEYPTGTEYLAITSGRVLDADRPTSPGGDLEWIKLANLPAGVDTVYGYDSTRATQYNEGEYIHYGGILFRVVLDTGTPPPVPNEEDEASDWTLVGEAPDFYGEGEFPNYILFHDRRLWIFGTRDHSNRIYASGVNDHTNFLMGADDADPIQLNLQLDGASLVSWAYSSGDIIFGTEKKELLITGGGAPITPSNVQAYPQSNSGSMRNGIVSISDAVCFLQKGGFRLLRFVYSNDLQQYQTPDMSQLSEHLLTAGVKEIALQSNPDFIIWFVMNDGTLMGATYIQEAQTFGWHPHTTDGEIESIEITRGNQEDIIWLIVRRPIRDSQGEISSYVRQLERFAPRRQDDVETAIYMDDAEILPVTGDQATVSEEKYGQTLACVQGGAVHDDVTAGATGAISLSYGSTPVIVGRAYECRLAPQVMEPTGSKLDSGIRITRAAVRFLESWGVEIGTTDDETFPIDFLDVEDTIGEAMEPFTGEKCKSISHSPRSTEWLLIKRTKPTPMTVLGVTYDLNVGGI